MPVPDKQGNDEEDDEDKERWENGMNDEEIDFREITERHRRNYECYAINKWRYAAESDFIELVERNCEEMMKMMGYKKTKNDLVLMKDIRERLIEADVDL